MSNGSDQLRVVIWSTAGSGIALAAAGFCGVWGWPAAALFVGACLMVFGVLTAIVAGAGRR